jgi:hypothetical protein
MATETLTIEFDGESIARARSVATRNARDFERTKVRAHAPEEFLAVLGEPAE